MVASHSVNAATEVIQYGYDDARQVLKVTYDDGTDVEYVYDNLGNRLFRTTSLAGGPANNPPDSASNPTPVSGAVDVSVTPVLSWTGGDPDSDPVIYYVYLGETVNPSLVSSGVQTSFVANMLKSYTTYYWKIVTRDNHGAENDGALWSFTTGSAPPIASFYADTVIGIVPMNVQYNDISVGPDMPIVSWEWDFDNDSIIDSTSQHPSHTYNSVGTYTVSLKVTDSNNNSSTMIKTDYIAVHDDTDQDFVPDGLDNCLNVYNPDQSNIDHTTGDVLGDECDPDMDEDGFENDVDVCPILFNPDQVDTDGDGYGDDCTNTICVTSSSEFQSALNTAKANNINDVIKLAQGTYSIADIGNTTFSYLSGQPYSLVIQGGYTATCASRLPDAANTILDGAGIRQVLKIEDIGDLYGWRNLVVEDITIQNGTSGLFITSQKGNVTIRDSIIKDNNSGISDYAATYMTSSSGMISLANNIIENNSTANNNVYMNTNYDRQFVSGNIIRGNTAINEGAGLRISNGLYSSGLMNEITITGNKIFNNSAKKYAGLHVYTRSETLIISNNIIADNIANDYSAGIYAWAIEPGSTITLINNTVTQNEVLGASGYGGGLYLRLNNAASAADLYNNIVWGNTAYYGGDIYIENPYGGSINAHYNDYDPTSIYGTFTSTSNNINTDPQYVDAVNSDYHLSPASSCIDSGLNSAPSLPLYDFEGDDRIMDGDGDLTATTDIGADEYADVCLNLPVRISTANPVHYPTIQEAYDASLDQDVIEIQDATFTGSLTIDLSKTVFIRGGFDCNYSGNSGESIIRGGVSITGGSLNIDSGRLKID